jgi:hypothetical protein
MTQQAVWHHFTSTQTSAQPSEPRALPMPASMFVYCVPDRQDLVVPAAFLQTQLPEPGGGHAMLLMDWLTVATFEVIVPWKFPAEAPTHAQPNSAAPPAISGCKHQTGMINFHLCECDRIIHLQIESLYGWPPCQINCITQALRYMFPMHYRRTCGVLDSLRQLAQKRFHRVLKCAR